MNTTTEYKYTKAEKTEQLKAVIEALEKFVPYLEANERYQAQSPIYRAALMEAEDLFNDGFDQDALNQLSEDIPDLFHRHKEWIPPLEEDKNGKLQEPTWFTELETHLQPVLEAASKLPVVGYY